MLHGVLPILLCVGVQVAFSTSSNTGHREVNLTNIATFGHATQESVANDMGPDLAVDGDTSGTWDRCTKNVQSTDKTWWKLEFFSKLQIDRIDIWNRGGTYKIRKRINGAEVYLDDVLCRKITFKSGTNPYKIDCGARLARNLTIVGGFEDGFLHICEVEVWSTRPPVNIGSKYGKARQDSVEYGGEASRAVDGNTDGVYRSLSCTHTSRQSKRAWWELTFSTEVQLDWINVWNRKNFPDRIDQARVYLDGELYGRITYNKKTNPYVIEAGGVMVRTIRIEVGENSTSGVLTLCEVEVFSANPPDVCRGAEVENGYFHPTEVIEGSTTTIMCNTDFRVEGQWEFVCSNGTWGEDYRESASRCVPMTTDDCKIRNIEGFLQYVCQDTSRRTLKCPFSNTLYDIKDVQIDNSLYSDICEHDPSFYQSCGAVTQVVLGQDSPVCGQYICNDVKSGEIRSLTCNSQESIICNNTQRDKICPERMVDVKCDGTCDDDSCEDESRCNGLEYGKFCEKNSFHHSILRISSSDYLDWFYTCKLWGAHVGKGARELYVEEYTGPTCSHTVSGAKVPIFNFTRCAPVHYSPSLVADRNIWWVISTTVPYCRDMMDQTNCTDLSRVAMSCLVGGYPTNISNFIICHRRPGIKVCDDGMEDNCRTLSPSCQVHKHKLCDKILDCPDERDETNEDCQEMTQISCQRVLGGVSLPIPLLWLGDGEKDCVSGRDEEEGWPTCGSGNTLRFVSDNSSCADDYLCTDGDVRYVPQKLLCDKTDTCGNENEVCRSARGIDPVQKKIFYRDKNHFVYSYCLKGFDQLQFKTRCAVVKSTISPIDTFGVDEVRTITMPDKLYNCDNMFGEMYLLFSCAGRCLSSPCPVTQPLQYDSCGGQFPDRVYSLANNNYLTFVTPSRGDTYHNDYFLCRNKGCVTYDKVCDMVDNCGDWSDEEGCTNHFNHCNISNTRIPKWRKCDGKMDCQDMTDECNEECGKEIIEGLPLKISSWAIGLSATALNSFMIVQHVKSLRESRSGLSLLNKLLIILIGIGDLLVGGYLFSISAIDVYFGGNYCSLQTEWLSSEYCTTLGVISTIGSQLSLFSMTGLSLTRLFGITHAMSSNYGSSLNKRSCVKVLTIVILVVMASVVVAIAPIVSGFEDFFVNGMFYERSNPLFVGFPDKQTHRNVIQAYYGRVKGGHNSISWSTIISLIHGMFSDVYGGLKRVKVEFYGNDGVCLFKYFVQTDDPQRHFSWGTLAVNFFCFLVISLSYLYINLVSSRSANEANNPQTNKRNRKMQRKISIIIATDFACWVPFVLVSTLHSLSVMDATSWYALFSVVILPINSVVNPILYDNSFASFVGRKISSVRNLVGRFSSFGAEGSGQLELQPQVSDLKKKRVVSCKSKVSVVEIREKARCRFQGFSSKVGLVKGSGKADANCPRTTSKPRIDSTKV